MDINLEIPSIPYETSTVKTIRTKKLVTLRPILVKEEKILLMGKDRLDDENDKQGLSEWLKSILQVLQACIVSPSDIKVQNLPSVDVNFLVKELRKISKGEVINLVLTCIPCRDEDKTADKIKPYIIRKKFNIDDLIVIENKDNNAKNIIKLEENYGIEISDYTMGMLLEYLKMLEDPDSSSNEISTLDLDILSQTIKAVVLPDKRVELNTKEDRQKFFDSLPSKYIQKIKEYHNGIERMVLTTEWNCPKCGEKRVLREVDALRFFGLTSTTAT